MKKFSNRERLDRGKMRAAVAFVGLTIAVGIGVFIGFSLRAPRHEEQGAHQLPRERGDGDRRNDLRRVATMILSNSDDEDIGEVAKDLRITEEESFSVVCFVVDMRRQTPIPDGLLRERVESYFGRLHHKKVDGLDLLESVSQTESKIGAYSNGRKIREESDAEATRRERAPASAVRAEELLGALREQRHATASDLLRVPRIRRMFGESGAELAETVVVALKDKALSKEQQLNLVFLASLVADSDYLEFLEELHIACVSGDIPAAVLESAVLVDPSIQPAVVWWHKDDRVRSAIAHLRGLSSLRGHADVDERISQIESGSARDHLIYLVLERGAELGNFGE